MCLYIYMKYLYPSMYLRIYHGYLICILFDMGSLKQMPKAKYY